MRCAGHRARVSTTSPPPLACNGCCQSHRLSSNPRLRAVCSYLVSAGRLGLLAVAGAKAAGPAGAAFELLTLVARRNLCVRYERVVPERATLQP